MKLKEQALANTLGVLGAIYFVGCWLVAYILPDLYKTVASSWMHMVEVSWKSGPSDFFTGFISFVIISWVSGYLFAWIYNRLAK